MKNSDIPTPSRPIAHSNNSTSEQDLPPQRRTCSRSIVFSRDQSRRHWRTNESLFCQSNLRSPERTCIRGGSRRKRLRNPVKTFSIYGLWYVLQRPKTSAT